ncbi:unnamed protein product [Chironomus riparius]|uniref:Uncharacterized protein n=1 Tax=Chironomus riparius TaxID=315576 RepID=A0A9N9RNY3_9DIPT|nr:unnamed protein product [Chironomus riparius]
METISCLNWFKNFENFRLFSDDKKVKSNDLEVVCLSNSNFDAGLSSELTTVDNCESIDNIFNYFESPKLSNLLKVNDKVYLFKLQVKEALNSAELCKLANKFVINSVVILLSTEKETRFYLYWKSNKIQHFLIFKIYKGYDFMNNLQLFEFIATFLGNSLRSGHLGLHNQVQIHPESNSYELHLLADHRNYNLLLIAAEMGNAYVANFILDGGISTEVNDMNAQTLAWNGRHFEIIFELLKSNHKFPDSINIEECPDSIKEFAQISHELNEAMILRNTERMFEIVSNNRKMKHFYNLENESALAFALRNKLFDIYGLLLSENIKFGPHEKFSEIKDSMRQSDKEQLREIHYKESKFLPENHMHVLLSNSRLGHGTIETEKKYEIIQKAFEVLNENPLIQVILMIVAASRNFRIIFDFNCDSVEVMDPTANETTRGLFYSTGRIYVAVKKLLNESTKYDALGTLAHEMCHYAVNLVYKNLAKPYSLGDDEAKIEFENILTLCKESCSEEEIIELVFNCYPHNMQHAELIVRVPHLIMLYFNDQNKFEEVRKIFIKLFEVFEQRVIPDMKEALPNIETKAEFEVQTKNRKIRNLKFISIIGGLLAIIIIISGFFITRSIFYKPTYKFSTLSNSDKLKIATAPIDYKNVRLEFYDLFPKSSKVYEKLTSDHISNMLKGNKPLNLSDSSAFYFHNFIYHNWKILSENLKQKVLNSNFTFQNQSIKFEDVNQGILESLTSEQIIDILENKTYVVRGYAIDRTNTFIERKFFDLFMYEIYFKYMIYVNGEQMRNDMNYSMIKNDTFEDFYEKFSRKTFSNQIKELDVIIDNEAFLESKKSDFKLTDVHNSSIVVDTLFSHKSLQLNFDEVFKEAKEKRIFILIAEEGEGKTTTFEQFSLRIKSQNPTWWVTYIDLIDLEEQYLTYKTHEDIVQFFEENIINESILDEFERKVFNESVKSGNTVLLWDGLDDISSEFRFHFLLTIEKNWIETKTIQFISIRPERLGSLMFDDSMRCYIFVPLDLTEQENILRQFITHFNDEKITNNQKIVHSINNDYVSNMLILRMVGELMSKEIEILGTETLYEIYDKFLKMKIDLVIESKFNETSCSVKAEDLKKFYQKIALKIISKSFTFNLNSKKLNIMQQDVPNPITNSEKHEILNIKSLGNNSNKFTFVNKLSTEFFIAQYLIENIYELDESDDSSIEELGLRLRVFRRSLEYSKVIEFIESYLNSQNQEVEVQKFNSRISKLLRTKFKRIFVSFLNENKTELMPFLMNFFSKDHDLLIDLLQINQNKTFYTELFNFAHSKPYQSFYYFEMNLEEIRSSARSHLNDSEYEKFIHGHNQKGIMLFSLYCYYMKESSLLEHDPNGDAALINTDYSLEKKYLKSHKPHKVFKSIAKNLTDDEYKELITSKTILRPILVKNKKIKIFDQNMMSKIEEILTIQEQKQWLEDVIEIISLTSDKTLKEIFLNKFQDIFSDSEIAKIFQDHNILQITAYYDLRDKNFNVFWNFYVNHTTKEEQILILKQNVEVQCTDYFSFKNNIDIEYAKDECLFFLRLNVFQYALLTTKYDKVENVYFDYFNSTEIQDIITSSDDFLPYMLKMNNLKSIDNFKFFQNLRNYFTKNENYLKKYLIKSREILSEFKDNEDQIEHLSIIIDNMNLYNQILNTFYIP